jgi:hypothetical protein
MLNTYGTSGSRVIQTHVALQLESWTLC